ncbi:kinase-like protein [Hypoxylon cercidicola]|nr:kinase-like protein [Hypoxylon cercidicola]
MATTYVPSMPDCGYFVDEDDECDVVSEAKPAERYFDNCYRPTRIGEVLNGQYCIEHKLGWGGFSTVWLARDFLQQKLVALKIMSPGWRGEHELYMHGEIIRRAGPDISDYLVTYQRAFRVPGHPGCVHTVLVLPFRGPSLEIACLYVPPALRVPAARRLLLALQRLHDAGIVHSDINSGAVMWDTDPIDGWSTAQIYERFGRPRKVLLLEGQGAGELVEPMCVPQDMLRPSLHLGDFSHSMVSGATVEYRIQSPMLFSAPERFHGMGPSFASDMWSYTCVLVELLIGCEFTYGDGLNFVSRIIGTLERPFPENWKGRYPSNNLAKEWWYDQTGQMPRSQVGGGYETLEKRIIRLRPDICQDERQHALAVMRKGFEYIPEKRITATEMLEDPSFNALMAYYEH